MLAFALITAIFGNVLFFLGILGLLYPSYLLVVSIFYLGSIAWFCRKSILGVSLPFFTDKKTFFVFIFLISLGLVNLIGALGPETSFDALWYHLTFPKLYLSEHTIHFFPGPILAYSVMPKFGELLFVPALAFGSEIVAKVIQFIFGILTLVVIYQLSRKFVSPFLSILACLIFYSNIVVSWESTVAYIDLIRAFYEVIAFYIFTLWLDKKNFRYLFLLGIFVGTAISLKILAIGSFFLFVFLLVLVSWQEKRLGKRLVLDLSIFSLVTFLFAAPWLVLSYISTGNPFYPIFSPLLKPQIKENFSSLFQIGRDFVDLFLFAEDPISPLYIIVLPLLLVGYNKLTNPLRLLVFYSALSLFLWFITPRSGGGRFILPYFPVWSVVVVALLDQMKKSLYYKTLLVTIFIISGITIGYRGITNARYLPVVFGQQSKETYLSHHLNFSFGDFYDTDGYFASHISPTDRVLLYGFHNFYYINFPFIDSSYIKNGDTFTYIATQHADLPKRFSDWKLLYENKKTGVKLYNKERKVWAY